MPMCYLFADDIPLQSSSVIILQKMLDTTVNWCRTNGMKINVPKCGTFKRHHGFKAGDLLIPVVDTYKYLGVPIDTKGIRGDLPLENNLKKATSAFIVVKQSLIVSAWPTVAKLNIYKMFIRSIIEYAAPLALAASDNGNKRWYGKYLRKLEKIQTECLQWVFQHKRSKWTQLSMAGIPTIEFRFQELTVRLSML